jgi:DNA polymerase III epsilon subunit-like protein
VVGISALYVVGTRIQERFNATVHPGKRVPRYVAQRLGLGTEMLDDQPPFEAIIDDLVRFFGTRPVLAQDARLTWSFLDAEARRAGRALNTPLLIDVNQLATRLLDLTGKPSLGLVAAQLGISALELARPEEETRVLAAVGSHLLSLAAEQGCASLEALVREPRVTDRPPALQRSATATALPDGPGVYVMRDDDQTALYVGKAGRLRSRVASYVNRPLGPTRRFEGLVDVVKVVDPTSCANDLEALVLEDREIRRLQPRFNTVRQQRAPRVWIRLPPRPAPRPGTRQLAPRRLEPSLGPKTANGEFVGPFRNESAADRARSLARAVFDLDALRHADPGLYEQHLAMAWDYLKLQGQRDVAEARARQHSLAVLRAVLAFDLGAILLPADPREALYAVVRPCPTGLEGFVVDRGICTAWTVTEADDVSRFAGELLSSSEQPRTMPDDIHIVLRWLGAQRPPARLVHLPDDPLAAADAIEAAAFSALGGDA